MRIIVVIAVVVSYGLGAERTGSVKLYATDTFGQDAGLIAVKAFIRWTDSKDFAGAFTGNSAKAIPVGRYTASVSTGQLGAVGGYVDVTAATSSVVICGTGEPIFEHRPGFEPHFYGVLVDRSRAPATVVLRSIHSPSTEYSGATTASGWVDFGEVRVGDYALTVFDEKRVLLTCSVKITDIRGRVVIDLSSGKAETFPRGRQQR